MQMIYTGESNCCFTKGSVYEVEPLKDHKNWVKALADNHGGTARVTSSGFAPVPLRVAVEKEVVAEIGGAKHDDGKPPMALLDALALEEVAKVLQFGARKYDPHNWRKGFVWSRLLSATLRHVWAFTRGEDRDPESGHSHLAHAICCLMFALNFQLTGAGTDDRWKGAVK